MRTTAQFINYQALGFLREWRERGTFFAAVRDLSGFTLRLPLSKRGIADLAGYDRRDAVVVGPDDDHPELWVRPDFPNYSGAFAAFASSFGDYDFVTAGDRDRFNVDHVFSHERAGPTLLGMGYVRTALVDQGVNKSWGAYVEKVLVETDAQHLQKSHHHGTAFLLAKLLGIRAPSKAHYRRDISDIADRLIVLGSDPAHLRDLLIEQMVYLYEQEVLTYQG